MNTLQTVPVKAPATFANRTAVWVLLLTLAAFGIRLWHLGYGLPHIFYLDEGHFTFLALDMGGGDLNPHFFSHPALFFYLCFAVDAAYILWGVFTGVFAKPGDAWLLFKTDPTVFYFLHRLVCAAMGTLTVPLTYLIGKRVFGKSAGLLAAGFLAFALLHVQYSRLVMLDVPLTFFTTLAFLLAYRAFQDSGLRWYALAGCAGGLAAAVKYQGFEILMLGPLAAFFGAMEKGGNPWPELLGRRSWIFYLFFGIGFTLGSPYWVLDFQNFAAEFLRVWSCYKGAGSGQLGYEGQWNWGYYLRHGLADGVGIPMLVAALSGAILLLVRPMPRNLYFLSFPLTYFAIAGLSSIRTARYMLPILPFVCLAAAAFLVWFVTRIFGTESKWKAAVLVVVGIAAVSPSLVSGLRFDYLSARPDTRVQADAWACENIPASGKALVSSNVFLRGAGRKSQITFLDKTLFDTRVHNLSSLKDLETYRKEGFQYLFLDEWHVRVVLAGRPGEHPQFRETMKRYGRLLKELEESSQVVAVFSPYAEGGSLDLNNLDIPSRSLWSLKSFGPAIKVYKLNP